MLQRYGLKLHMRLIDAGRGGSTNPKQETNTWGYMIYSLKWRSSNRSVFRGIFVATRPRFTQIIPRIWGTICRNPTFWMVMPILGHMSQQPAQRHWTLRRINKWTFLAGLEAHSQIGPVQLPTGSFVNIELPKGWYKDASLLRTKTVPRIRRWGWSGGLRWTRWTSRFCSKPLPILDTLQKNKFFAG